MIRLGMVLAGLVSALVVTASTTPAVAAAACGTTASDYKGEFTDDGPFGHLVFDGSGKVEWKFHRSDKQEPASMTVDGSGVTIKFPEKQGSSNPGGGSTVELTMTVRSASCFAGDSVVTAFAGTVADSEKSSFANFYKL